MQNLPYPTSGLVPVKERHIAVNQDQVEFYVTLTLRLAQLNVFFDYLQGLKPVETMLASLASVYSYLVLQDNQQRINVE